MSAKITEKGVEVFPGINIPWDMIDGFLCGLIEKGDASILTDPVVKKLDDGLEKIVQDTSFKFDNVGKAKLLKALALSMVEKYSPELLSSP